MGKRDKAKPHIESIKENIRLFREELLPIEPINLTLDTLKLKQQRILSIKQDAYDTLREFDWMVSSKRKATLFDATSLQKRATLWEEINGVINRCEEGSSSKFTNDEEFKEAIANVQTMAERYTNYVIENYFKTKFTAKYPDLAKVPAKFKALAETVGKEKAKLVFTAGPFEKWSDTLYDIRDRLVPVEQALNNFAIELRKEGMI